MTKHGNLTLTPGQVREVGEAAWVLAQDYAKANGLTVTKQRKTGHLVTVNGGVSKFVREAAQELSLSAYMKEKWERDRVREFLKQGYNVVAIGRGDAKYEWRIFVADEWTKNGTVPQPPKTISKAVSADIDRLSKGESGPVENVNLWDEFQNEPLGPSQASIIKALYEKGGRFSLPSGFTMTDLMGKSGFSLGDIERRGLIVAKRKNPRRYEEIKLNQRGWWAAERLSYVQTAEIALFAFITQVGRFEGSTPQETTAELAQRIHKLTPTTVNAIQNLEEKGYIKAIRNVEHGPYHAIERTGKKGMVGVHINLAVTRPAPPEQTELEVEEPVPTVPPATMPEPATTPPAQPVTRDEVEEFVERLRGSLNESGERDGLLEAMNRIKAMCRDVEMGNMSALRAIVEIDEITKDMT